MDDWRTLRSHPALLILWVALGAALLSGAVLAATSSRVPAVAGAEAAAASAPSVRAASGILVDRRTGKVLWSTSADLRLAPASCTKIMTALLVLERYRDLDRTVRAPAVVTDQQTVAIGLRPGDRISVRQALRAVMTKSANDACVTLATAVGGSETGFVKLMNRRAAQLGLTRTRFVNSRGTPKPGHYSSARDLARLGRYAMRDARFRDLVGTKTRLITWPPSHAVSVTSHNRLLDYPWGDGIKSGSTRAIAESARGIGQAGARPPDRRHHARAHSRPGGEGRARAPHVGFGAVRETPDRRRRRRRPADAGHRRALRSPSSPEPA